MIFQEGKIKKYLKKRRKKNREKKAWEKKEKDQIIIWFLVGKRECHFPNRLQLTFEVGNRLKDSSLIGIADRPLLLCSDLLLYAFDLFDALNLFRADVTVNIPIKVSVADSLVIGGTGAPAFLCHHVSLTHTLQLDTASFSLVRDCGWRPTMAAKQSNYVWHCAA